MIIYVVLYYNFLGVVPYKIPNEKKIVIWEEELGAIVFPMRYLTTIKSSHPNTKIIS